MSAWIVSKEHIDLIITAAITWEYAVLEKADEIGRMLWLENLASVARRYPQTVSGDRPGYGDRDEAMAQYEFEPIAKGRMDPEVVAVAAASLIHQSCEHAGWAKSEARTWILGLKELAEGKVPEFAERFGPIDVSRQVAGQDDWYTLIDIEGVKTVRCSGAWRVDDRELLVRTEALRGNTVPR